MPFTTAPRPLDVAARWPELAELARTAVRLHMGGEFLDAVVERADRSLHPNPIGDDL